jgi:HNH endonuclease
MRGTAKARFWAKVRKVESGCWEWTGAKNKPGYGVFRPFEKQVSGRKFIISYLAHRYAWEITKGPIADGKCIDHRVCRNKVCVNPGHLVVCTLVENILQPDGAPGRNSRKTHCPKGHEYTPENIYKNTKDGRSKRCRACTLVYARRHHALKRKRLA